MATDMSDSCIGVVLAGGRSRRMGRDKALLEWQGRSLLEHAIARFETAGIPQIRVSGARPEHAGIPDAQINAGPLAGLLAVAREYPDAWLVVVAVDMPRLPPAWLARLAGQRGHACAAYFQGAPLPLAFAANADTVARLQARLDDPHAPHSIQGWLAEIGAHMLPPPTSQADALANINTPAEWEAMPR